MDISSRPSVSSLQSVASSSQSSIRKEHFQYDILGSKQFRIFKLDLNEEDEPLSGVLLTSYHFWNSLDTGSYKHHGFKSPEKVVEKLSGEKVYDTFSYTWGDQTETFPLRLAFIGSRLGPDREVRTNFEAWRSGSIRIGSNLKSMLEELRRRKHQRFVWIDAICINQSNDMEKKEQISMMADIYEYAGHGYVWLGQGNEEEIAAMQIFTKLVDRLKEASSSGFVLSPTRANTFVDVNLPEPREKIWAALGEVMRRPYWSRLWTLQEVVVAERTGGTMKLYIFPPTEVYLGSTTTKLEMFNQFCIATTSLGLREWIITGRTDVRPATLEGFDGIDEIRTCRQSFGLDFWGVSPRALLLGTRRRQATIPDDMVYGMLAMMDKPTARTLSPATHSSTREIFLKFAKYYIRNEHKEHLFNHLATVTKMEGLPSWCPNFASSPATKSLGSRWIGVYEPSNTQKAQMYHAGYSTSGKWKLPKRKLKILHNIGNVMKGRNQNEGIWDTDNARQLSVLPDTDCLLASGMHVDFVAEIIECNPAAESSSFFSLENILQTEQWEAHCLALSLRSLSRDVDCFDHYTRTLTANRLTLERSDGDSMLFDHEYQVDFVERYRKFKAFLQALKAVKGDMAVKDNIDHDTWHYADVMSRVTCRRRFFATVGGRVGLGPAETEIGDAVSVIFYCPTPYILRHSQKGQSQLIGEAYVHGLMYGEALDMLERGEIDETQWVLE